MKKLLILSYSPLDRDPRVDRQIRTLYREYELVVAGLTPPSGLDQVTFVSINRKEYDNSTKIFRQSIVDDRDSENPQRCPFSTTERAMRSLVRRSASLLKSILKKYKIYLKSLVSGAAVRFKKKLKKCMVQVLPRFSKPLEWYNSFHFDLAREKILAHGPYDAILANDLSGLILVRKWNLEASIIYDAHEYSPGQYAPDAAGREKAERAERFLREQLPNCAAVMTVCDGIAEEYAKEFGIAKPVVVTNATRYVDQEPRYTNDDTIRLVHHGVAAVHRKIENMIDAIIMADSRYELDLYLIYKDPAYYQSLKERASTCPRIRFQDPVPMQEIAKRLNTYDAGFYILEPINFNQLHALPNKLFEFVQARIGILIGPSPEMARFVETYQLGAVADDFSPQAMSRLLADISRSDINRFKENAHRHAFELSGEVQARIISELVMNTVSRLMPVERPRIQECIEIAKTVS